MKYEVFLRKNSSSITKLSRSCTYLLFFQTAPKKRKAGTPIGYINAEDILPRELLDRIREYIEGEAIYIPRTGEKRVAWGERNGTRNEYDRRNRAIISEYKSGRSVAELAESYALCEDSIRKILRGVA